MTATFAYCFATAVAFFFAVLAVRLDRQLRRERLRRQVAEARLEVAAAEKRAGRVLRIVEGGAW